MDRHRVRIINFRCNTSLARDIPALLSSMLLSYFLGGFCILPRLFYDPPNFPYAYNGSRYQSTQYANRLSKYCYLLHLAKRTYIYAANGPTNNQELLRANRAAIITRASIVHRVDRLAGPNRAKIIQSYQINFNK